MKVRPETEWLDYAVVLSAMAIIAFVVWALVFRAIPDNQLAIVSSIASGLLGTIIGAYAGFRWATSKQASETIANLASRSASEPQAVQVVNASSDPVPVESKE